MFRCLFPFCFPSPFYFLPLYFFPTLSTSSLYLFLKINLYYNLSKRYKLPHNSLIINSYLSSACIFSPLACIFLKKNNLYYNFSKRYKLPHNSLIINSYLSSACICSHLACIFWVKLTNTKKEKRYKPPTQ